MWKEIDPRINPTTNIYKRKVDDPICNYCTITRMYTRVHNMTDSTARYKKLV